ncbi:restriction endonuclease subunit S [Leptospira ilyithenensis]|uniref:Restriction endonuclease subunit S n=1 Tax=Leptospira ilyithenensis TaxID=2484901 RepID=A0A4R9LUG2_9LEPT|nr:restriction endonuclease subunit S [Leptospira ilyithenensis]TGN14004.1 restriction endonuclease subunit S [Leptospira ilyithenensis]
MKPYPKYRDSGVEWLGQIPEGWEVKKLKYLASCFPSNVDKKSKEDEEQVKLCNYTDVYYNEKIDSKMEFMIATCTPEQKAKFSLKKGDVIITKDSEDPNDIAVPAFVPEDLNNVICGYHLAMIRAINTKNDGFYLNWMFKSRYARSFFATVSNGLTRYGLGTYAINNATFLAPPLAEQKAIATFLDRETTKIDTLIAKQEQLIALLEEKRQALISHAVTNGLDPKATMKDSRVDWLGDIPEGWEVKKLKYLFKIKKRIAGKLGYQILSITQRGIRIKDISNNEGQISMDYSKYQLVYPGDFAMNHMDLLTGSVDISKFEGVTSPDYRVFVLSDKHSYPEFFKYVLLRGYTDRIFYNFGQGSSQLGRWRLPTEQFEAFMLPFPKFEEQKRIADFINMKLEKSNLVIKKSTLAIEHLKEKRSALISSVVTGKIDVRELV